MDMKSLLAVSLLWLGLGACGAEDRGSGTGTGGSGGSGGSGGVPSLPPAKHTLVLGQPVTISAGGTYGYNFQLPKDGTLQFSASQTTTDTWNVAVFTPAQWVTYQTGSGNQASGGVHNNVMQVSDAVVLPKGDWYLGFRCNNAFQRCMFVFNADITY